MHLHFILYLHEYVSCFSVHVHVLVQNHVQYSTTYCTKVNPFLLISFVIVPLPIRFDLLVWEQHSGEVNTRQKRVEIDCVQCTL